MNKKFSKLLPIIGCFSLGLASIISAYELDDMPANLIVSIEEHDDDFDDDCAIEVCDDKREIEFNCKDGEYNTQNNFIIPYKDAYQEIYLERDVDDVYDLIDATKSYKDFIAYLIDRTGGANFPDRDKLEGVKEGVLWLERIRVSLFEPVIYPGGLSLPRVEGNDAWVQVPIAPQFFKDSGKYFTDLYFDDIKQKVCQLCFNRLVPELVKAMDKGESFSLDLIEDLYRSLNSVTWFFNSGVEGELAFEGGFHEAKAAYEEINSGKSDAKVSIMTEEEYNSLFNTEEVDPKTQKSCRTYHDAKRNLTFRETAQFRVLDPLGNREVMVFYTKERH